tara:strand:- start:439 stop:1107 length:669 start_codon:yes stop_codon:yes gene_type:complete
MENYRFEKKFVIKPIYFEKLLNLIEINGWRRLFPKRRVNNIYFDSINLNSYYETIDGDLNKKKYRIRWYGDTFPNKKIIENCFFETKIKINNLNYKIIRSIEKIKLYHGQTYSNLNKELFSSLLKEVSNEEFISIENNIIQFISYYDRLYYTNENNSVRLTIDKNQNYFNISPKINYQGKINSIVIELKYSSDKDFNDFILSTNLTHNSKYKNGIDIIFNRP